MKHKIWDKATTVERLLYLLKSRGIKGDMLCSCNRVGNLSIVDRSGKLIAWIDMLGDKLEMVDGPLISEEEVEVDKEVCPWCDGDHPLEEGICTQCGWEVDGAD